MKPSDQVNLLARMAQWPVAEAFIESFCARHGIARATMLRLTLMAEELFTNAVEHAHDGGADAPIRLGLACATGEVTLFYEEAAPPFDVLSRTRENPPDFDLPVDERPVGGLGIHLVDQLADSARYAREDGCNRLWLTLRLRAAEA
jgi:anti-sigma regulatory factor (Ser/Thr protein kinase)